MAVTLSEHTFLSRGGVDLSVALRNCFVLKNVTDGNMPLLPTRVLFQALKTT